MSLAAWAMLLVGGRWLHLPAYCGPAGLSGPGWMGLELAIILNPPTALAAAWLTMLAAMMPPLLENPLAHLWQRSFARRRLRAVLLFLLGYVAVWTLAGAVLMGLAVSLRALLPEPGAPPLIAAAIALVWQVSPWKQTCLNRCHGLARLSPFGLAADRDALRFGLTHGLWCAGACWALMALPLAIETGHLAAMALVALFLFAERQVRARPPAWRLQWPRTAFSISGAVLRRALPRRA